MLSLEEQGESEDPEEREFRRAQRQIDKIRASKDDAVRRYQSRLEYLQTKLKSAEIHERLLKK